LDGADAWSDLFDQPGELPPSPALAGARPPADGDLPDDTPFVSTPAPAAAAVAPAQPLRPAAPPIPTTRATAAAAAAAAPVADPVPAAEPEEFPEDTDPQPVAAPAAASAPTPAPRADADLEPFMPPSA